MDDLQKIQNLVDEFFSGLVSRFPNKKAIEGWGAYKENDKFYVEYLQNLDSAYSLRVFSSGVLFGIENYFYINGQEFLNPKFGLQVIKVKFCLNDLKYHKEYNSTLLLYLEGSEFDITLQEPPITWTGHKQLGEIVSNTRGCFIFLYDEQLSVDFSLPILAEIQRLVSSTNGGAMQDSNSHMTDSSSIDKSLNELRDLLG